MKTYFTQEALAAVKEKISKFQAGGTTAEIRPDNRSWIRREIVDPVRTWVMTRPGYETAVQIQYSPHATSVSKEYKTSVFDNDNFKKTFLKSLEAASFPISESFFPIQAPSLSVFRQFQRLSPEQLREVFQEFKDNTTHENTLTNKR